MKKIFTWGPIAVASLMLLLVMGTFTVYGFVDQPDPIIKDGAVNASWILVGLAGAVVSLLTTIFLFAWRVIQMQGITLNKTTVMQNEMQVRMKVLEEVCLPSHLNKKGNAEKMARILQEKSK